MWFVDVVCGMVVEEVRIVCVLGLCVGVLVVGIFVWVCVEVGEVG